MRKNVNIQSHDELIDRVKLEGDVEYYFDRACFDKITRDKLYSIGYLDAPASKGHHLAEPMGLARHSVNVTQWLVKLTNAGVVRWAASESPYRIGMLHDLVKCKCYAVDPDCSLGDPVRYVYRQTGYVGHGAASALIAMSDLAINLTPVECACIVHHMGAFGLDERQLKEYDAALDRWPHEIIATHTADILAARVDEGGKF